MSTYSNSLRVELITSGDQAGQWGNTTNDNFSYIFDRAIAGYQTVSVVAADQAFTYNDGPVSSGALNQAIYAMIELTTTTVTTAFNVYTNPRSKQYVIWNNTSYPATIFNWATITPSITAAGTGVTIAAGDRVLVVSDGTNFYTIKSSGVTGTLPIANGGTGQTTQQAALNALAGSVTSNQFLRGNGTNVTMSAIQSGDLPLASVIAVGAVGLVTDTLHMGAIDGPFTAANRWYGIQLASPLNTGVVNVPWTDTTYSLATSTVEGLVKLGSNTVQSVASNSVTATASRTYAIQLNSSGQAVVNVPWTGTVTGVTATSPVASSGGTAPTISLSTGYGDTQNPYASKTANFVLAAPSGSAGAPTFRQLVADDIPTLNQNTTGNAATATNIAAGAANQIPRQSAAGTTTFIAAPTTASTYLSWDGSAFTWSNVTPGSTFATDISVNTLTVGKGPNNPVGATTVGYQAGAAATASNVQQTALGYRALASAASTAGVGFDYEGSTAVGYKALESSVPSLLSYNTAVGAGALRALTTGGMNTAVGAGASRSMTGLQIGSVAVGALAAENSTVGGFTVIGYGALRESKTQSFGSVAVGSEALRYATTNSTNSAIYNSQNTAIGHNALFYLDADTSGLAGSNNTALGYQAGYYLESGSNNTIIGYGADASAVNVSNEITLGNSSITTLRCQVTSITSLSDQRDKYDIEDLPVGLNLINALRPRRYKWDKRDWYVDEVTTVQEDGQIKVQKVPASKDGSRAQTNWNEGFVAQEAKAALESLGAQWFPLVYESNPEKLEMSSGKLIPVLVKAIQELTARIEALEAE